jgi:glucose-1-phosphate cytidylyltransferase
MIDTAVILCGGRGSRMGISKQAKSLCLVNGKPIIWYIIHRLYKAGFKNFVLPLGFLGNDIREHIEQSYQNLNCKFYFEDTGNDCAIGNRILQIRKFLPEKKAFFLTNGDALFDFNIEDMILAHQEQNLFSTFVTVDTIAKYGVFLVDKGTTIGFEREALVKNYVVQKGRRGLDGEVYSGMAVLNEEALDIVDLSICDNFEAELYPKLISLHPSAVFRLSGFWYAIDTLKDLKSAEGIFKVPIENLVTKLEHNK